MSGRRATWLRAAALGAVSALVALPLVALAESAAPGRLVVTDTAGDANGVNDRGGGFVRDVRGPLSVPEADLTRLAFTAVRDAQGRATGFGVTFTSVAAAHPVSPFPGGELTYSAVLDLTPECRLSLEFTVVGEFPGRGELQAGPGCSTRGLRLPLTTTTGGTSVRLEVPYDIGPDALRPGEDVDDYYAYTSDGLVTYDTLFARHAYALPG